MKDLRRKQRDELSDWGEAALAGIVLGMLLIALWLGAVLL
jgi:hypothetical protein